MSRWIDIDDDRNCYIGNDGEYEKWNIDPDVMFEGFPAPLRWIPVSERYPEPNERVLVTDGYCYYVWDCMSNRTDAYFWEDESGYYHNKYDVVAWMPLLEPYKEGE